MSLRKANGNMYPWVTHVHTHLGGECPHKCSYCYVDGIRFGRPAKYTGPPRLVDKELGVTYGSGKTIFLEHMSDLFAEGMSGEWISKILNHAWAWPGNTYVLQTKNPARAMSWFNHLPPSFILGTTIETNRDDPMVSKAPPPSWRAKTMRDFRAEGSRLFVTIEPVMDFDPEILAGWFHDIKPEFVNIGADSKGCGLPEPSAEKIRKFLELMGGIEIRVKTNLRRIMEEA